MSGFIGQDQNAKKKKKKIEKKLKKNWKYTNIKN